MKDRDPNSDELLPQNFCDPVIQASLRSLNNRFKARIYMPIFAGSAPKSADYSSKLANYSAYESVGISPLANGVQLLAHNV